jgi:hypothetical protein
MPSLGSRTLTRLVPFGALSCVLAIALTACAASVPGPRTPGSPQAISGSSATSSNARTGDGPVRNQTAKAGEEIVTLRYWKIRKGSFPQFLEASQTGVWPYFEKIGARIVGMWRVLPDPDGKGVSPDYDEVYLMTRYASLEHWSATRNAAALGGDGPDFEAYQRGLAVRQSLTLETRVTYLQGKTGPLGPVFLPPTGERFEAIDPRPAP